MIFEFFFFFTLPFSFLSNPFFFFFFFSFPFPFLISSLFFIVVVLTLFNICGTLCH